MTKREDVEGPIRLGGFNATHDLGYRSVRDLGIAKLLISVNPFPPHETIHLLNRCLMVLTLQPRIAVSCAALALVLSACISTPTPEGDVWDVTPASSFTDDYTLNSSNSGYIQITRDSGLGGSACTTNVSVGTRSAAKLRPAERVTVHLAVGEYKVSAEVAGMCPGLKSEQTVQVTPGVTTRLRIRYSEFGGAFGLVPDSN